MSSPSETACGGSFWVGTLATVRPVSLGAALFDDLHVAVTFVGTVVASWCMPHGGLALTTRPGAHLTVIAGHLEPAPLAVIVYLPAGSPVQTTPPSLVVVCTVGSGTVCALKYVRVPLFGEIVAVTPATPWA